MWYIKSYIPNIYVSSVHFLLPWPGHLFLMLESEGSFFQNVFFFSSESNRSTFYFKEISIKSPFLSSFPSKNYKEMSLIFCTSTVLETDWGWDPFAFPNFFLFYSSSFLVLCPFWSFPTFLKDGPFLADVGPEFFHLVTGERGSLWLNYFIALTHYQFFGRLFLHFLKKSYLQQD